MVGDILPQRNARKSPDHDRVGGVIGAFPVRELRSASRGSGVRLVRIAIRVQVRVSIIFHVDRIVGKIAEQIGLILLAQAFIDTWRGGILARVACCRSTLVQRYVNVTHWALGRIGTTGLLLGLRARCRVRERGLLPALFRGGVVRCIFRVRHGVVV